MKRNLVRVIVNVEDTNDNAPWFTGTPYTGRVFESAAVGSRVLQVTALDKDKGQNAEIVYSIESGNQFIEYLTDKLVLRQVDAFTRVWEHLAFFLFFVGWAKEPQLIS